MVHEGFQASTGRTILVRVDDIPPAEREDVTQFFHAVQRLSWLNDRPVLFGVVSGLIVMVLTLIALAIGLKPSDSELWRVIVCASIVGASCGVPCWTVDKVQFASYQRVKLLAGVNAMFGRSERCRIAAEQLRRTSDSYARMLPAPASAS